MQKSPKQLAKLDQTNLAQLEALHNRIIKWTRRNRQRIEARAQQTRLPEQIINRAGDNWVPLFAVADAVGGDWSERVTAAALEYEHAYSSMDRGILLLNNLKTIMNSAPKTFFSSQELLTALNEREDWSWGEYGYGKGLSTHALARYLRGFGVCPRQERIANASASVRTKVRGYDKRDLEPVWKGYGIQAEADGA